MKKILIVGGGGIGSWLAARLNRLSGHNQFLEISNIVVADNDEVENKNVKYQNFTEEDVLDFKAEVIDDRYYYIESKVEKIVDHSQLNEYDIIVSAVDNAPTRKLIYRHCIDNDKYLIDLRAEGTGVWAITSDADVDLEDQIKRLGEDETSRSCQRAFELESNIIQLGNTIIAEIGAQMILNHCRGKKNSSKIFSHLF